MDLYPYLVNLGMPEGLDSEDQTQWLRGEFRELEAKLHRRQAIIDQYPKTADGKPVAPGMTLYFWFGPSYRYELYQRTVKSVAYDGWLTWVENGPERGRSAEDCYFSHEAANKKGASS